MSTDLLESPQEISLGITNEWIEQAHEKYGELTVTSIADKEGLKIVHEARMTIKKARTEVEKKRRELKADALAYGKQVDAAAKAITSRLNPLYEYLEDQEAIVEREKDRLAKIEEERLAARLLERVTLAQFVQWPAISYELQTMSDEEFDAALAVETTVFEAKKQKEAEAAEQRRLEDEARTAEAKRLAMIAAEQEAREIELQRKQAEIQAAQDARQAELDAKQEAIEAAQRVEDEAKAERARLAQEETDRIAREAEAAAAKTKAVADAKAAEKRKAAMAPDRQKIVAFAAAVMEVRPKLTKKSKHAQDELYDAVTEFLKRLEAIAANMHTK